MNPEEISNMFAESHRNSRKTRRQHRRKAQQLLDRDLEIFKAVAIEQLTHENVAYRFGTSRGRVSQIVKEVRRRLAQANPSDPDIQNHLARQRLESELEKMRYQHVLDTTAKAMQDTRQTIDTQRKGGRQRDGKEELWDETIMRFQPLDVRVVRTFLRATEALGKLNQRDIESNPIKSDVSQFDLFNAIAGLLGQWRARLPTNNDPPSSEFIEVVAQFERTLHSWTSRYRYTNTAAEAWPDKRFQPAIEPTDSNTTDANPCANQTGISINHTYDASPDVALAATDSSTPTSEIPPAADNLAS